MRHAKRVVSTGYLLNPKQKWGLCLSRNMKPTFLAAYAKKAIFRSIGLDRPIREWITVVWHLHVLHKKREDYKTHTFCVTSQSHPGATPKTISRRSTVRETLQSFDFIARGTNQMNTHDVRQEELDTQSKTTETETTETTLKIQSGVKAGYSFWDAINPVNTYNLIKSL